MMSNVPRTLYVGVTSNLEQRVYQHKNKLVEGFTSRYDLTHLVYYAETNDVREAIAREKQIKGWTRAKKVALIEEMNPYWEDLSASWYSNPVVTAKETDSSLRSE
jgi:putative endonuclease